MYFDYDHRDMKVYGNIIALDSKEKRGTAFLYKSGSQGKGNLQSINCFNNIAINSRNGFWFVSSMPSRIENNVAVNCGTPFSWTFIKGAKSVRSEEPFGAGKNMTYTEDPGFVNLAKRDFRLRPIRESSATCPASSPSPSIRSACLWTSIVSTCPATSRPGAFAQGGSRGIGYRYRGSN